MANPTWVECPGCGKVNLDPVLHPGETEVHAKGCAHGFGMGVRVEMTRAEARAFVAVLKLAAEEFSNHGCNDFDVAEELGLTSVEGERAVQAFREGMVRDGVLDEADGNGSFTFDFALLDWLRVKVERALASRV